MQLVLIQRHDSVALSGGVQGVGAGAASSKPSTVEAPPKQSANFAEVEWQAFAARRCCKDNLLVARMMMMEIFSLRSHPALRRATY